MHLLYSESLHPLRPHPRLPRFWCSSPIHPCSLCWKCRFKNLVPKFVDVVEQPVEGKCCFIGMWAVVVASARLDHHDVLGKCLPIFAAESHLHSPGLLGRAASAIHTRTTVLGSVFLHTGTASISKLDWFGGLLGLAAFLALFQAAVHRLSTRSHLTNPGFFHQAAFRVVIGNPC